MTPSPNLYQLPKSNRSTPPAGFDPGTAGLLLLIVVIVVGGANAVVVETPETGVLK